MNHRRDDVRVPCHPLGWALIVVWTIVVVSVCVAILSEG